MKKVMRTALYLALLPAFVLCHSTNGEEQQEQPDALQATVYTTSVAGKRMTESSIALGSPEDVHSYKVELNGESYQSVDGFGFAITHASCYNLLRMSDDDRHASIFCVGTWLDFAGW